MKTKMRQPVIISIVAVAAMCACGDSSPNHETLGVVQAADTPSVPAIPTLLAPCGGPGGTLDWNGSNADLLVADAVAGCSAQGTDPATGAPSFRSLPAYSDFYLQNLYMLMSSSVGAVAPGQDLLVAWVQQRATKTNCGAGGQTGTVTIKPINVPQFLDPVNDTAATHQAFVDANADLRTAGINLCVAQQLRNKMPGAASDETLLFSEADQRKLLEVIRERSQIAMLQYALLGEV